MNDTRCSFINGRMPRKGHMCVCVCAQCNCRKFVGPPHKTVLATTKKTIALSTAFISLKLREKWLIVKQKYFCLTLEIGY